MIRLIYQHLNSRQKCRWFFSILLSGLSVFAELSMYVLVCRLIVRGLRGDLEFQAVLGLLGALFVLACLRAVSRAQALTMSHRVAFESLAQLRKSALEHLSHGSLGSVTEEPAGALRTKIVDTIEQMELMVAHVLPEAFPEALGAVVSLLMIFIIDWRLGLVSLIPVVLGFGVLSAMLSKSRDKITEYYEAHREMDGALMEFVGGIEVLKVYNQDEQSFRRMSRAVLHYRDFTKGWYEASGLGMAVMETFSPAVFLFLMPLGLFFLYRGSLSTEEYLLALLVSFAAQWGLLQCSLLIGGIVELGEKFSVLNRLFTLPEIRQGEKMPTSHSIDFQDVCFSYEDQEVLHSLSFSIGEGEKVAFVGESGSGKSTILKLLLHYYDVSSGKISLGGIDLTELSLEALMDHIAYVSQENFLFDGTIEDNLRVGKPDATKEQIIEAAKAAHIHEKILSLPHGYETRVGDAGSKLSGGERQRLCIARAIIKDAPILLLDEMTSYMDPENEQRITEALEVLSRKKTVVTIAHKLGSVKDVDRIIFLDKGRILAMGSHDELLQVPAYAHLWERYCKAKNFEFREEVIHG